MLKQAKLDVNFLDFKTGAHEIEYKGHICYLLSNTFRMIYNFFGFYGGLSFYIAFGNDVIFITGVPNLHIL